MNTMIPLPAPPGAAAARAGPELTAHHAPAGPTPARNRTPGGPRRSGQHQAAR